MKAEFENALGGSRTAGEKFKCADARSKFKSFHTDITEFTDFLLK